MTTSRAGRGSSRSHILQSMLPSTRQFVCAGLVALLALKAYGTALCHLHAAHRHDRNNWLLCQQLSDARAMGVPLQTSLGSGPYLSPPPQLLAVHAVCDAPLSWSASLLLLLATAMWTELSPWLATLAGMFGLNWLAGLLAPSLAKTAVDYSDMPELEGFDTAAAIAQEGHAGMDMDEEDSVSHDGSRGGQRGDGTTVAAEWSVNPAPTASSAMLAAAGGRAAGGTAGDDGTAWTGGRDLHEQWHGTRTLLSLRTQSLRGAPAGCAGAHDTHGASVVPLVYVPGPPPRAVSRHKANQRSEAGSSSVGQAAGQAGTGGPLECQSAAAALERTGTAVAASAAGSATPGTHSGGGVESASTGGHSHATGRGHSHDRHAHGHHGTVRDSVVDPATAAARRRARVAERRRQRKAAAPRSRVEAPRRRQLNVPRGSMDEVE